MFKKIKQELDINLRKNVVSNERAAATYFTQNFVRNKTLTLKKPYLGWWGGGRGGL